MAKRMQVGVSADAVFASRNPEPSSLEEMPSRSVAQAARRCAELPTYPVHVKGIVVARNPALPVTDIKGLVAIACNSSICRRWSGCARSTRPNPDATRKRNVR